MKKKIHIIKWMIMVKSEIKFKVSELSEKLKHTWESTELEHIVRMAAMGTLAQWCCMSLARYSEDESPSQLHISNYLCLTSIFQIRPTIQTTSTMPHSSLSQLWASDTILFLVPISLILYTNTHATKMTFYITHTYNCDILSIWQG